MEVMILRQVKAPARINPWARALATVCVAASTLLSCTQSGGEKPAAKARAEGEIVAAARSADGKVAEPASLGELPAAVARLEALQEEVEKSLVVDDAERRAGAQLDATLRRVDRSRKRVEQLPLDELIETSRRLANTDRTVSITETIVSSRLRRVEKDLNEVDELKRKFATFDGLARQIAAPAPIHARIALCRTELDQFSAALTRRRSDILLLVDKLAEARGGVATMKAMTESRIIESRRRLSELSEEPIWRLQFRGRQVLSETADHLARDGRRIRRWISANLLRIALIVVVCFGGMVFLALRLRRRAAPVDENDPAAIASRQIGSSPLAAGICVSVLAIIAFSPQPPTVIYDLAWLLAAPAAALVIVRMLGPSVARTVWVLAASLALAPFVAAVGALPFVERLVVILQTAPLAVVLGLDLARGRLSVQGMKSWERVGLKSVAWLLVGCLGAATAGCLLGWVALALMLSAGALGTLGGIIVIVAAYLVLCVVLRHVLTSRTAQVLLMVREHADVVSETCLKALRAIAVLAVVFVSVEAFGMQHSLRSLLGRVFGAKATLGSISLSAGSIAGFVLVFATALLLARLLAFVLAEEVLPRFDVRRGTARAISATTRYLILLAGFVLAAGIAGIDLTTFGFIAGALGVGIGFGLQNIVSNFISGLILLFERPIQVGDVVEVSGATGVVTEIGIRASTVHTFDGAEVIVPNADLISKSVTNWTRSNSNRRFDIPVGVAYGSPLEATAQVLLVAAQRTAGILAAPAPEAFLKSFGPSALEWTLRVWVRLDESPQVLSALKRAMSEELQRGGISVPFPQRDVHVRSVVVSAEDASSESSVHG